MRSGEQQFDASELMVPRVLHYPPLSDYPSRWPAQADDDGPALHPNHFRVESVLNTAWKSLAKDCNRREGVQAPPLLAPVVVVVGVGWALGTGHLLLLPSPPLLSFLLFSSSPLPPPAAPPPSHIPLPVLGHPRSSPAPGHSSCWILLLRHLPAFRSAPIPAGGGRGG